MDANDAATAIAEGISGTEGAFANRMNLMAKSLGMINTTFKNAPGFIEKGHLSSAFDMAILGRRLTLDFPNQYKILSERESSTDLGRRIRNSNTLFLNSYKEIEAVKSGYSRRSGYNFFATAKKSGLRLIIVSFGNKTMKAGIQEGENLFDIGFSTLGLDPSS